MVIFALFVASFFWFTSAQNVWKTNGPYGEQVTSLALDPSDSLLIYAGTGDVRMVSPKGSGNGVYRTTDGGKTWEHTSLDSVFIWDIEIDSRSNVYAATRGYGVFKSTDKGETWHPINNGLGCLCISCVVIDPLNDSILYVGTGDRYVSDLTGYCKDGIYRSMDGGQSWSQLAFDDMVIGAIAIDPTSPEIIYAGVYGDQDTSGIYKSVDGGQTWQKKYADTWASAIVIDPANTNIVYADGCGLIKSTDGGETWAGCGVGAGEIWTIAVDPLDPNIVYAGNAAYPTMDERFGGFYRSIDGGKTFSEAMIGMPHQPIYSIVVDSKNSKVYVGNDGPGVFMSIDKGKTWQWLSNRMTLQRVMGLTINPRDGTVLATTWSWGAHAAVYKSTDFGDSWFNSSTGIYQTATVCIAVAPSAPDTVYLVTRTAGRCPLYRSFDSGTSWQECDRLWSPTTDIAVNPLNAKEFYLACGVLRKSIDAGSTIAVILPYDTLTNAKVITVAVDAVDTNVVVYVGGGACPAPYTSVKPFVYKSTDGGSSWVDISEGLRYASVQDLAVDPFDHNVLYAAVCSLDVVSFFRYDGNIWEERSEGLDGFFISSIAVDGCNPGNLYLGTKGGGVYRSMDDGLHWSPMNEGLTNLYVNYVIVDPTDASRVYAGTDSGAYVITLPQGVEYSPEEERPSHFYVHQNHPNPFAKETEIRFALPKTSKVLLKIYDISGKLVKVLVDRGLEAGSYTLTWDGKDELGRNVPAGIYFLRMGTSGYSATRKLLLMR